MNNCPKCGSVVNQGESFCKVCGSQISSSNDLDQNQVNNNQNLQFNSNYNNIVQDDDDLIDAYIGKNSNMIKNSRFSIFSFFFNPIYSFYMKMWLLGFIVITINVAFMMFLESVSYSINYSISYLVSYIVMPVTNLVVAFNFNKWYLNKVRKKVQKIKAKNPEKTKDELIVICKKKGGTTIIPIIICICIILAFIIMPFYSNYNNKQKMDKQNERYNNIVSNPNKKIGNLHVIIPDTLKKSDDSNEDLLSFNMKSNDDFYYDYCSLKISKLNYYSDPKKYLEDEMYNSSMDTFSDISQKRINGNDWYYAQITDNSYYDYQKNYYSISKDNITYYLKFEIEYDGNKKCSSAYNTVINSLKLD